MPHICERVLLSSHKKPIRTLKKIMNENTERIKRFLILLRRSGALLADLINFTKLAISQMSETTGSPVKTKINMEKGSNSH